MATYPKKGRKWRGRRRCVQQNLCHDLQSLVHCHFVYHWLKFLLNAEIITHYKYHPTLPQVQTTARKLFCWKSLRDNYSPTRKSKMVAGTATTETVCQVEAKRLWNAMVKDGHNLVTKVLPEIFASVTLLQGDGGVGTIRQLNFTPANKDFSYIKERVDEIDEEKMVYKYTTIEGGSLGKKISAASFEVKFAPTKEGGCVASWICNYETLPGVQVDEGREKEIKEASTAMLKKIEQYLLSNPNLYC